MASVNSKIADSTYLELVRSLFTTVWAAMTMALCFLGIGLLVLWQTPDIRLAVLVAAGTLTAISRVVVVLRYREQAMQMPLPVAVAQRLERNFTIAYQSFAVIFGVFCATALLVGSVTANTSVIGLMFGYGAGVASRLSLRPWISVPGVIVATVPTIVVNLIQPDMPHVVLGLLIAVFMVGGIQSMLTRYRETVTDITMRRSFARLARSDHLTGLPNRLWLREHFEEFAQASSGGDIVAVHCLDLDRFKPVNDRFGHPVGDAVLQAVASRLLGVVRECDFAARVGGDEFVVVQMQAKHVEDATALATRIVQTIAEPFVVDGHVIEIATSVGYALSSTPGCDLAHLVARADRALCAIKRRGGGIERYDADQPADEDQVEDRVRAAA